MMSASQNQHASTRHLQIKTPDLEEIISELEVTPKRAPVRLSQKLFRNARLHRLARLYYQRVHALIHKRYPFDVPPPGRSAAGLGPRSETDQLPPFPGCAYTGFSLLAEGGEGRIETACDPLLQRVIAVKTLKEKFRDDPAARERFRREAVLTANLSHPGIVPVYALYPDPDGNVHSAMKLIDGESLDSYLRHLAATYRQLGAEHFDEGRALRERLRYFLQICSAVSFAHEEAGVIHRDLKPENVMLGRFDQVYVMDWGAACRLDESDSEGHVARILGTPSFLAPESLLEKVQNVKTDIYALGLLLYEIVFLKRAFPGTDTRAVVTRVLNNRRKPPFHAFNIPVDRELKAIIAKASAYYPSDRYNSVKELSDDLKNYLAGRETKASPDHFLHAISRWHRLNRHAAAVIYLLILLTVLLLGGGMLYHSAVAKTRRENQARILSKAYASAVEEAHRTDLFFYQQQQTLSDFARDAVVLQRLPLRENAGVSQESLLKHRLSELLFRSGEKLSRPPALWATLALDSGPVLRLPEGLPAQPAADARRENWYQLAQKNPRKIVMTRHLDGQTRVPTTRLSCALPDGRGVVSLVLSPAFLKRGMTPYQTRKDARTVKWFVSRSGLVTTEITDRQIALLPLRPESPRARRFCDPKLFQEIVQRNYGALFHHGVEGLELVAFAYLPTLDSWYVTCQRVNSR